MKFTLKIEDLGRTETKHDTEKDMYHLTFKTYNASIEENLKNLKLDI